MSLPPYDQSVRELERQFQVVLPDSVGQAALGFREGVWFRVNAGAPRPVPMRSAIILCPHAAGSIVQIACWWMRENARSSRALDLATELALCVGELARKAIEDDPLGMSLDSLSTSQQNALAGLGASAGFDAGGSGYNSGGYQTSPDPYAAPAYSTGTAAAGATTVLPQIPGDGYGVPPAQRGPAVPPRGPGMPSGPAPQPLGSGGYPQRPAPQQMRPQPGGGPYGPGPGGRPAQQRPVPRPEQRYPDDFRGDGSGRPPGRGPARPDPGSAW
jgi:hypothetical protein